MKRSKQESSEQIELRPDGWERFKRAVAAAAKVGPKHRKAKEAPKDRKQ
ncbi:MAG: hypothetical protein M3461_00435 [Pseudomonadota bacterium]|nr:hypothetical protein [Pseudomonadota bacterium]